MLDPKQLRDEIIDPTLKAIGLYTPTASELILGTFLVESGLRYVRQVPTGPGRGFSECEEASYQDIRTRIQEPRFAPLYTKILAALHMQELPPTADALIGNITLAVIITRLKYYLDARPLPEANSVSALAHYWKAVYNTEKGKGKPEEFVRLYNTYAKF